MQSHCQPTHTRTVPVSYISHTRNHGPTRCPIPQLFPKFPCWGHQQSHIHHTGISLSHTFTQEKLRRHMVSRNANIFTSVDVKFSEPKHPQRQPHCFTHVIQNLQPHNAVQSSICIDQFPCRLIVSTLYMHTLYLSLFHTVAANAACLVSVSTCELNSDCLRTV